MRIMKIKRVSTILLISILGSLYFSCKNDKDKAWFLLAGLLNQTSATQTPTTESKCTNISSWTARSASEATQWMSVTYWTSL